MNYSLPQIGEKLGAERLKFLKSFKTSCKRTIIEMLKQSQSGHTGGSLSMLDVFATLYAFRITDSYERMVISNGHISPVVYATLAECGVIPHQDVIDTFRQIGSVYEGHVTRHVPGIYYGTGPLGIGASVASGMALADMRQGRGRFTFATVGDGECQEGQIHEMALNAAKNKLGNLVVFCDHNRVQLSASVQEICSINVEKMFKSHGWQILTIDGHDPEAIWGVLADAQKEPEKPTMVIANTIMGYGIEELEKDGREWKSTWHGNAPTPDMADEILTSLYLNNDEKAVLDKFRTERGYDPVKTEFFTQGERDEAVNMSDPIVYEPGTVTDCRSAYGNALLSLAKANSHLICGSADLSGSVKTSTVQKELPDQYLEHGICEQHMVSQAAGLALSGVVPFVSTFATFMSSRAKGQVRVNDINHVNVKMVATHAGLSVGEDGPTHQCIDDMGAFAGMLNLWSMEPADANQCDRMTRYMAGHKGHMYMRMGRHKFPVLLNEEGGLFYDEYYEYYYGRTDLLREGKSGIVIVAIGATATEALQARETSGIDAEILVATTRKDFDDLATEVLNRNKHIVVVEDHNSETGLASGIRNLLVNKDMSPQSFTALGVNEYQLSGKADELYHEVSIDAAGIAKILKELK